MNGRRELAESDITVSGMTGKRRILVLALILTRHQIYHAPERPTLPFIPRGLPG